MYWIREYVWKRTSASSRVCSQYKQLFELNRKLTWKNNFHKLKGRRRLRRPPTHRGVEGPENMWRN